MSKANLFTTRYNGPNLVLKYNHTQNKLVNIAIDDINSPYFALRDRRGNAIGVTACDVDGDGREEIYFLNKNNAYSGRNSCILPFNLRYPLRRDKMYRLCRAGNVFRQALQVS